MDASGHARITELASLARQHLSKLGTDRHRNSVQRFFREPVLCHGVPTPLVREYARELWRQIRQWPPQERNALCDALWEGRETENGTLATCLLGRFARRLGAAEFDLCELWIASRIDNWAHCDGICIGPLADCLANQPGLVPRAAAWASRPGVWERRAAAVSFVKAASRGLHLDTILTIAGTLRQDPEDLVRKGTGWMLKEAYSAHPEDVVHFLTSRPEPFPRLVLRYAAEKMTPADRERVLLR